MTVRSTARSKYVQCPWYNESVQLGCMGCLEVKNVLCNTDHVRVKLNLGLAMCHQVSVLIGLRKTICREFTNTLLCLCWHYGHGAVLD